MSKLRPPLPDISVSNRNRGDANFLALVNEDPTRHYRWVRCRSDEHFMSVTTTKLGGYRLEHYDDADPTSVRPVAEVEERRPDKVIAVGDLILMSCSMEDWERSLREQHNRTEALLASTSAQTEEMAKEKGISIIKDADHNR
jgi:hypothetical protein